MNPQLKPAKPNQSLAEWTASMGGVRLRENHGRDGEIARLREANKVLRGRRRIVSPTGGIEYDRLAIMAREAGFPVEEDTFLDVLEEDAFAWANGLTRKRCYADYDLTATDYDFAFELEAPDDHDYQAHALECRDEEHEHAPCTVCGRSCGEGICSDCLEWATETTRELLREQERNRAVMAFFENVRIL